MFVRSLNNDNPDHVKTWLAMIKRQYHDLLQDNKQGINDHHFNSHVPAFPQPNIRQRFPQPNINYAFNQQNARLAFSQQNITSDTQYYNQHDNQYFAQQVPPVINPCHTPFQEMSQGSFGQPYQVPNAQQQSCPMPFQQIVRPSFIQPYQMQMPAAQQSYQLPAPQSYQPPEAPQVYQFPA